MELQQPFYERVMRPTIQRLARAGRRQEGGMVARIDAKLEKAGYPGGLRGADWVGVKMLSLIVFAILCLARSACSSLGSIRRRPARCWSLGAGDRLHRARVLAGPEDPGPQSGDGRSSSRTRSTCSRSPSRPGSGSTRPSPRSSRRWRARWSTSSARRWPRSEWAGPRREALRDVATRADAQPVSNFIGAIVQAEQLGVPIAKVLQIQSNQLRIERRQRAEEAAAKAPVKMLFPMVGCIFPTIFIVILGPAVVTVMGGGLSGI